MAKAKKIDNSVVEAADQLDEWAKKYRVASNSYVQEISEALRSETDLHKWAEVNPFDLLPTPEPTGTFSLVRRIELLTNIRNVLVFAPVALTWAAVGAASSGFEKYVAQNGATVVNFLEFWQNGYGFLASFWRLSDIARLDFLIIATVIVLTVFTSTLSRRANRDEHNEYARIESDRTHIATKLVLALSDKQKINNVTFNKSLAGAIQRLTNATKALEKTAKELQKSAKKLPKVD